MIKYIRSLICPTLAEGGEVRYVDTAGDWHGSKVLATESSAKIAALLKRKMEAQAQDKLIKAFILKLTETGLVIERSSYMSSGVSRNEANWEFGTLTHRRDYVGMEALTSTYFRGDTRVLADMITAAARGSLQQLSKEAKV